MYDVASVPAESAQGKHRYIALYLCMRHHETNLEQFGDDLWPAFAQGGGGGTLLYVEEWLERREQMFGAALIYWYCCELTILLRNGMPCVPSKTTSCLTKPLVKLFRHPGLEIALSDWGHGGADMVCFFEGGIRTKEMSKNVAYVAWSIFVVICLFGSVLYLQNFNLTAFATPTPWSPLFNSVFLKTWSFWTFVNVCCL